MTLEYDFIMHLQAPDKSFYSLHAQGIVLGKKTDMIMYTFKPASNAPDGSGGGTFDKRLRSEGRVLTTSDRKKLEAELVKWGKDVAAKGCKCKASELRVASVAFGSRNPEHDRELYAKKHGFKR